MAVLLEFDDAGGDTFRVEEVPKSDLRVVKKGPVLEIICVADQDAPIWLTPALARRVAHVLTEWADKEDAG